MAISEEEILDVAVDENGDMEVPIRFVSGLEGVVQLMRIAVKMFKDELFTNQDVGVEWLPSEDQDAPGAVLEQDAILGERFNEAKMRAALRREILAVPAITEILLFLVNYEGETRMCNVQVQARTLFGDTPVITSTFEVPNK